MKMPKYATAIAVAIAMIVAWTAAMETASNDPCAPLLGDGDDAPARSAEVIECVTVEWAVTTLKVVENKITTSRRDEVEAAVLAFHFDNYATWVQGSSRRGSASRSRMAFRLRGSLYLGPRKDRGYAETTWLVHCLLPKEAMTAA
jgi:hypothetical protein